MDSIRFSSARAAMVCMAALLGAAPAFALYKVVGPDGKVSFTDRPPADSGKVQQINPGRGTPAADDASLPFELRQAAQKYPVTLYVTTDCGACDAARQLLRSRGVPFTEKTVTTAVDGEALERLAGGRELPVVTIGAKMLRGLQREEWSSYLDAAGYPKTSMLPVGYRAPAPSPLVPSTPEPKPAAAPAPAPNDLPAAPAPGGFRF